MGAACSGLPLADSAMQAADQLGVFFEAPLSGNVTLTLDYFYALAPGDTGFHLDPYAATDGTRLLYGATHMEVRC